MIKKKAIAYGIFTVILFYIISPWVLERILLLNELLSATGLLLLAYKRFKIGRDTISICMLFLLLWGSVHLVTSLFRMDSFYYYLRNAVIVYSMLAFFIGYYCLKYLGGYINKIGRVLRFYLGVFVVIRLPWQLFERFGMSMLFPVLFKKTANKWVPYLLLLTCVVYGFVYDSLTALILACIYFLLFISPGYRFFKQLVIVILLVFTAVFIYLQPNLSLISHHYSFYNQEGIYEVMRSSRILHIDGNSTWRMVLWKQIIADDFPKNIFGLGFGTPALKYYPVAPDSNLASLPYVLGSHNSFVYLFGRLGIVYAVLVVIIYRTIFREYFYYKTYYYSNNRIALFWSFFAITAIALFNPTLESPIYASAYWLILGFVAKAIHERQFSTPNPPPAP